MAAKLHTLISAGPTREMIDQVRDWGNIFTGETGLNLALAFLELGDVTLLTSNADHVRNFDGYYGTAGMLGAELFRSYADLRSLLGERMTGGEPVDVVGMSAAVSDYTPAGVYRIVEKRRPDQATDADEAAKKREMWIVEDVSAGKVKSHHGEILVRGVATPKLIDLFRTQWRFSGLLLKFKLEVGISEEDLLRVAETSRVNSGADLMVANTLAMARGEGAEAGAYLMDEAGAVRVGRNDMARKIVEWVKLKREN